MGRFDPTFEFFPTSYVGSKRPNLLFHQDLSAGCPVALYQLAYVQLNYWGFDNENHDGVLIVSKEQANEVVDLFKKLYEHHDPIQSMKPMDLCY